LRPLKTGEIRNMDGDGKAVSPLGHVYFYMEGTLTVRRRGITREEERIWYQDSKKETTCLLEARQKIPKKPDNPSPHARKGEKDRSSGVMGTLRLQRP